MKNTVGGSGREGANYLKVISQSGGRQEGEWLVHSRSRLTIAQRERADGGERGTGN
jgi:hypothetical protein